MPNWCSNTLTVRGSRYDIRPLFSLLEGLRDDDGLFSAVHPPPEDLKNGGKEAYLWRLINWGTKWDVCRPDLTYSLHKNLCGITVHFSTAWAPPVGVVSRMKQKFPTLKFTLSFNESANGISGTERW